MGILELLGPLMGMITGGASTIGNSIGGLVSFLGNQQRMDQGMDIWKGLANPMQKLTDMQAGAGMQFAPGGNLNPANAGGLNDMMVRNASDLLHGSMNYLQGQGDTERRDINTQFNNAGAAINADLSSRGLAASTTGAGPQAAMEQARSNSLGGLNERINSQYLNTSIPLWQNLFSAQTGAYGNNVNALNSQVGMQGNSYGTQSDYGMNMLNWLTNSIVQPYPNQSMSAMNNQGIWSGIGNLTGQTPNPPSSNGGAFFGGL